MATLLFDEGAVTLILVILVNCRFILERSSNTFGMPFFSKTEYGFSCEFCVKITFCLQTLHCFFFE